MYITHRVTQTPTIMALVFARISATGHSSLSACVFRRFVLTDVITGNMFVHFLPDCICSLRFSLLIPKQVALGMLKVSYVSNSPQLPKDHNAWDKNRIYFQPCGWSTPHTFGMHIHVQLYCALNGTVWSDCTHTADLGQKHKGSVAKPCVPILCFPCLGYQIKGKSMSLSCGRVVRTPTRVSYTSTCISPLSGFETRHGLMPIKNLNLSPVDKYETQYSHVTCKCCQRTSSTNKDIL